MIIKQYLYVINVIMKVYMKFEECKGVFIWEYINSPPDKNDASKWCKSIKNIDTEFILI